MNSEDRRLKIIKILEEADEPISGTLLSKNLGVSRQVVVQDIALIRAKGMEILPTPKGYIIYQNSSDLKFVIRCVHTTIPEMETELYTIVDNGGKVLNVIVEHDIYGEISANLNLSSRLDIDFFIEKIKNTTNYPLSFVTSGVHFHTILCKTKKEKDEIIKKLKEKGIVQS